MPYIAPEVVTEAKRMDLLTYLRTYEPGQLVRVSGNTYCTREHDSLKISNGKWMWWSRGIGGRTALDYLIKVKELSFIEAVETIMGNCAVTAPVYETESRSYENQPLLLPQKSPTSNVVTQYLFGRGIDYEIINECLDKELIIESLPYHNVVFIGYDDKKEAKYAAYRATNNSRIRSFDYALTQMGYEHSLSESRKYWTIVPKGYTKPIRLKNLGEDYTEEAIKRRLMENQRVRIVPFAKQTVVIRQYRLPTREQKIKKVGGLYGLYLHYCYKLGYLPKYKKQNTKRLHYLLKEDLLKLDKITAETRLLGREHIFTDEQLFSYKASLNGQIETLIDDRTHLRKISRTKMSDDELSKVKGQIVSISGKIRELRKEVWLCDDIAERSKVMEQNLETIRAEEEKQERKEQNRYDKRR